MSARIPLPHSDKPLRDACGRSRSCARTITKSAGATEMPHPRALMRMRETSRRARARISGCGCRPSNRRRSLRQPCPWAPRARTAEELRARFQERAGGQSRAVPGNPVDRLGRRLTDFDLDEQEERQRMPEPIPVAWQSPIMPTVAERAVSAYGQRTSGSRTRARDRRPGRALVQGAVRSDGAGRIVGGRSRIGYCGAVQAEWPPRRQNLSSMCGGPLWRRSMSCGRSRRVRRLARRSPSAPSHIGPTAIVSATADRDAARRTGRCPRGGVEAGADGGRHVRCAATTAAGQAGSGDARRCAPADRRRGFCGRSPRCSRTTFWRRRRPRGSCWPRPMIRISWLHAASAACVPRCRARSSSTGKPSAAASTPRASV